MGISHPSRRTPVAGEVVDAHAYYCETRAITPARVQALLPLLSRDERRRADRATVAEDRRDYVAAHALLRLALGAHLRTPPERLVFGTDARGRPCLVPGAGCSGRPRFSLTHSRDLVACAVSPSRAVGIDAERMIPSVHPMTIARACFSPEEVADLERLVTQDRSSRLYELWTLKEALLKAMGLGMTVPLDRASFQVDARSRHVSVDIRPPLARGSWVFSLTDVAGTHTLAIALGAPSAHTSGVQPVKADLFAPMAS
jgi:4'-phosphopantetheinyl transferase